MAVARPHTTTWEGHYRCAQGETALRLTIETEHDGLDATFDFGPLPENPSVPHGAYRMHGTATRLGDGEYAVILSPTEWIDHPNNYVMVGLQATTMHEHRLLRGTITYATCGEVELSRVR